MCSFKNVAIPMRAQPPHYGHIRLIRRFRMLTSGNVVVFLCRDFDQEENPFTFDLRKQWLQKLLIEAEVNNVLIPRREQYPRNVEYSKYFKDEFVVVVTKETLSFYRNEGFKVINHLQERLWTDDDYPLPLHSNGRVLRRLLRNGQNVDLYIPAWLATQAREKLL